MTRKSGNRFSLATNAERVCAEVMLKTMAPAAVWLLAHPIGAATLAR
ncbi:hypothetical protein ABIE91_008249 [Bradyrhizobium elkanii]